MEQSPNAQITTNDALKFQEGDASKKKVQGTKVYGIKSEGLQNK